MKKFIYGIFILTFTTSVHAEIVIKTCSDLAGLVKLTAEQRDKGIPIYVMSDFLLGEGVDHGIIGRTLEWVYNQEPEVSPRTFYKEVKESCIRQNERTRK